MREYEREIVFVVIGVMVFLCTLYIDTNKLSPFYWFYAVYVGLALNLTYRMYVCSTTQFERNANQTRGTKKPTDREIKSVGFSFKAI